MDNLQMKDDQLDKDDLSIISESHDRARDFALRKVQKPKVVLPSSENYYKIRDMLKSLNLNTVCQEAHCPNIGECWGGGTATFMLMGDTCTRGCKFCAVKTGNPKGAIDKDEPYKVGFAISKMDLDYIVLTSVNRDDLPDEGAGHFAQTVSVIRKERPEMLVEVLAPDFHAREEFIMTLVESGPHVYAHNMETVESLTPKVRDRRANYKQSLKVLEIVKRNSPATITKTSLMLGHGETADELRATMKDLRNVGCDVITFGQYLRPTKKHMPVKEYINDEIFKYWEEEGLKMGFRYVASGALVRSSYRAGEFYIANMLKGKNKG